jgi:hypothetical protein
MSTPASGWYPDGEGRARYWDGGRWTSYVRADETPEPGPRRRSAWPWVVAGTAVVALVAGVVIALVIPLLVGAASRVGAERVVRDFNAAWAAGDCTAVEGYVTRTWWDVYSSDCEEVAPGASMPVPRVTVVESNVGGTLGVVRYVLEGSDGSTRYQQEYVSTVVRVDGNWLILDDLPAE